MIDSRVVQYFIEVTERVDNTKQPTVNPTLSHYGTFRSGSCVLCINFLHGEA